MSFDEQVARTPGTSRYPRVVAAAALKIGVRLFSVPEQMGEIPRITEGNSNKPLMMSGFLSPFLSWTAS
jgi:hypothetical protein